MFDFSEFPYREEAIYVITLLLYATIILIWVEYRLSMVSGNGVNSVPRPNYRTYRKMADAGVQYEPQDTEFNGGGDSELVPAFVNHTVAEINTSAEIAELDSPPNPSSHSHPSLHRPLSLQSSTSSASSSGNEERGEKRRTVTSTSEEVDVDAICVQRSAVDELAAPAGEKKGGETEPDGRALQEKEESSCGLDCLYFTMQCCECTIL